MANLRESLIQLVQENGLEEKTGLSADEVARYMSEWLTIMENNNRRSKEAEQQMGIARGQFKPAPAPEEQGEQIVPETDEEHEMTPEQLKAHRNGTKKQTRKDGTSKKSSRKK
jgi:uncharacterized protein (DUF1697 family)